MIAFRNTVSIISVHVDIYKKMFPYIEKVFYILYISNLDFRKY